MTKLKSNHLFLDTSFLRSFPSLRTCLLDPSHTISVPEAKSGIYFLEPPLGPFLSKPEVSTLFDRYAITLPATQVCSVSCELPIATSSILPMKAGGCISIFQKRLFWVYDLPRVTQSLGQD